MSLDAAQAKPAFKEYGLKATKRFLKTAIVIDDEIIAEPPTQLPEEDLAEPPLFANAPNENHIGDASPDVVHQALGNDAEVKIRPLADAFLDKRIVCGVLKPEVADTDSQVIDRAVRAASVADVVIIDWYLRPNQDNLARSILEKILTEDRELNGRLRLVIVYTSADPLADRRKALGEHLKRAKFDAVEDPNDDTLLTIGTCRVRFVRKRSINVGVAVEDLPDFAVEEFAKLSHGLLANFALLGIAALRDATHHILANLDTSLDTAFVGHRMLLGHVTEARGFAMNLFLLQMKSVLSLPKHLGNALGDQELSAWLDEHFSYPEAEAHLEAAGTTKDQLRESVLKGAGRLDGFHKSLFLPISKNDPAKVGDIEKELSQNFARFATFVREPGGFNPLPEGWLPTLTLGSVVKQVGRKTRYFLCVQPACDTVRITESRYFPFIELVAKKAAKSTENLVIRDGEKKVVVYVSTSAGSRLYDKFKPDLSETVRAESEDGRFLFNSSNDHVYWWLGDIDPLKAQRIATDVSGSLARVGIDEYEWLRLGGSAKK
ncbi:response regulator receiver domain [Agrobacterium sp. O3.4]|uniref:Response receiver domain-containing protein n=1 Tax=Agrobacterium cucumeris TaxID=2862866 RepID=A0ABY8RMG7_9HYPH|nr:MULTISPECIES: response regulator receiver domain [Rhizobium/Agrobacterium group]MCZ7468493.1 response regulator receiver domain [Rhizobium rhizogenes]WHO08383.1 hypothetical protein KZ699_00870 [Agrobacterium cucumeris]